VNEANSQKQPINSQKPIDLKNVSVNVKKLTLKLWL